MHRWERIGSAVGLLVLGALIQPIGGLAVDHFASNAPKVSTEPVFTAGPNDQNYNYVFTHLPNHDSILSAIKNCSKDGTPSQTEAKLLTQTDAGCQSVVITEAGGIAPLGIARIVITNPTSQSVVITEIRSVTDSVEPSTFVEYWSNPAGGETGDDLVFDLDSHSAPALLEGPNEGADKTVAARPEPYFDSKSLEIPPGRSESIFISASGRRQAVYKWHLEVTLTRGPADGSSSGKPAIYRVSPPNGEFVGAHIEQPGTIPVFIYVEHMS